MAYPQLWQTHMRNIASSFCTVSIRTGLPVFDLSFQGVEERGCTSPLKASKCLIAVIQIHLTPVVRPLRPDLSGPERCLALRAVRALHVHIAQLHLLRGVLRARLDPAASLKEVGQRVSPDVESRASAVDEGVDELEEEECEEEDGKDEANHDEGHDVTVGSTGAKYMGSETRRLKAALLFCYAVNS